MSTPLSVFDRLQQWLPGRSGQSILFRVSMYWRIFYGGIRVVVGLKLLTWIGMPVVDAVSRLLGPHVHDLPHDRLYTMVHSGLMHHNYVVTYFLASYLLFWGIVDILLSYNLLRDNLWAFPVSMYLIGVFMVYELLRLTHTHSLLLATFIGIDSAILYLIYREYQRMLRKRLVADTAPAGEARGQEA